MKDTQSGWYLVYTKPKQESIAETNLKRQGFRIYLPLLQTHKRRKALYEIMTEPLFPRYLFVYLTTEMDDWSKIRSTYGCVSLVRFGTYPARIPDQFIEKIQQDEVNRVSQKQEKIPDFKIGDKVQILDGILTGYEGIIKSKNSQERITLLLNIAEEFSRPITMSVHQIKLAT